VLGSAKSEADFLEFNLKQACSMKTIIQPVMLILAIFFLAITGSPALIFTNLYNFSASAYPNGVNMLATNGDGVSPTALVLSGNVFYGTANSGGTGGVGTIFRINTDGTHFTNLYNFPAPTPDPGNPGFDVNNGSNPNPRLLLVGNTLYGTTFAGGPKIGEGVVYRINTDGSDFAVLVDFTNGNGFQTGYGVTWFSNALYGTTLLGGTNGDGTLFQVNPDGSGFVTIYNFTNYNNTYGGLVASSNALYGFAESGGAFGYGMVYRVGGGGGFADIFDFAGTNGAGPYGTPTLVGNTLYGVTYQGGTNGGGNVFRISTDGQQFTNLYNFPLQGGANTTGSYPYDYSGLVVTGDKIIGTTSVSGSNGQGTVFEMNTDGSNFTILHSFGYGDGGDPETLVLSGGTLYGLTTRGGQGGSGVFYALILSPTLNLQASKSTAVLSWNDPAYSLYSAPALTGAFTKISGATSPYTNAITGTQKYFELK
jgi:uncharacterized repeat protein (TIGR03803 family)